MIEPHCGTEEDVRQERVYVLTVEQRDVMGVILVSPRCINCVCDSC